MLHLDDVQLYELSEAGPLLFKDPARLAREARIRAIPSARIGPDLGLPAPWVDAETGRSATDPESVAAYWLGRLAPPAPDARKPRRDRARLAVEDLLPADEAARRLFATPAALARLDREGRMPSLRVDGAVGYDPELVGLMAAATPDAEAIEARRAAVRAWARYEYETATEAPSTRQPTGPSTTTPTDEAPPAPAAFEIPADLGLEEMVLEEMGLDDLGDALPPLDDADAKPRSDLLDIEGFDTVDED